MGLRPHLSFCARKTARLAPELLVSVGPCPHLWFFHAKQTFGPELQVSMGPRPHLSFCACKRATLGPCLYGSLTSSVVLSTHNSVLSTRVSRLYGFQPSSVFLCMQNSAFRTRITSLCGFQTAPVVLPCKTATSGTG